ncbi:MAG: hypothetical protein C9356_15645 [Oleiphilus sp.]|nr:MAG: hypothetical protein C9356_15645 [Oleiphilus sp.]
MRHYAFALLSIVSIAANAMAEDYYRNSSCDSWHLYCDSTPVEEEQAKEPPPSPTPPKEEESKEAPAVVSQTLSAGASESENFGSVVWLRENMPKLLEKAIDHPTDQNIKDWAFAHKLAMDKSERFSIRVERIMKTNPLLDESNRKPSSLGANRISGQRVHRERLDLFSKVIKEKPIVFVFKSNCPMCDEMAKELRTLQDRHDLTILPISKDGKPLSSGLFANFKPDTGQLDALGIFTYPATLFYDPEGEQWLPIAYSIVHRKVFIKQALLVAVENGWISEQDYLKTRSLEHYTYLSVDPDKEDKPLAEGESIRDRLLVNDGYE